MNESQEARDALTKYCWLLLPPFLTFALCIFWLKAFPVWSYIVEGVFLAAFFVAVTVICVKYKAYMLMVKLYCYAIISAITFYLMSEVPKMMGPK